MKKMITLGAVLALAGCAAQPMRPAHPLTPEQRMALIQALGNFHPYVAQPYVMPLPQPQAQQARPITTTTCTNYVPGQITCTSQ